MKIPGNKIQMRDIHPAGTNFYFRKCEFDDRDNAPKHCIGKEFDKRPCKGPPCRPFWDYSEWDKCDCLSLKTHRRRICKRITSKDTADVLPDRDCYGLSSEPLEKNCVGPEVKKIEWAFAWAGSLVGIL